MRRLLDGAARVWLALILLVQATQALAGVDVEQIRAERQDAGLFLHAHLKLDVGPAVEDALIKGVAIYFVAEAELMRDRWYWYDRKVSQVSRYYRLAYQPLTRQWRLQVSSEPLSSGGTTSTTIAQSFDSLQAALDVVRRQTGWKLADAGDLEPEARQHVLYRFRLDMSQLPRPFQIVAGNQSDWSLSLSRQLRLTLEPGH
ncbi:MAG: DUF4390 domain-containing protein [Limnohabitans sp.]